MWVIRARTSHRGPQQPLYRLRGHTGDMGDLSQWFHLFNTLDHSPHTEAQRLATTPSSVLREGHIGVRGDKKLRYLCLEGRCRACANARVVLPAAFARPASRCDPCSFRPPLLHSSCTCGPASVACSCRKRQRRRKRQVWKAWT